MREWLDVRRWDSWREVQEWLSTQPGRARIGFDPAAASEWASGTAFGIPLLISMPRGYPEPQAVELVADNAILVGADQAIYVVGADGAVRDTLRFGSPFHAFVAATDCPVVAVFETGLLSRDEAGALLWRVDTDLIVNHHVEDTRLSLSFADHRPQSIDLRTGQTTPESRT